jgi:hypothetical protein
LTHNNITTVFAQALGRYSGHETSIITLTPRIRNNAFPLHVGVYPLISSALTYNPSIPGEHLEAIFSFLDPVSLNLFARTGRLAALLVERYRGVNVLDLPITGHSFTNFHQLSDATAGSPEGSSASDDTLGSSDTEMSSPEPEYEFEMTEGKDNRGAKASYSGKFLE